ncbi:MAG: tRNA (adenosine(37)-N6)-dimethylallyltransferase MiaA [Marinilabiliaceae bacterium]|nr:tRNA (adenosine(37)-N6)-dimethylallyltransferase MiaA [Marinilabiliaceae bacterium]
MTKNISQYQMLTILGPTAVGKTRLAALLASRLNGEILSADSRQVYREMNYGTGKDYDDYIVNGQKVPYHLVDIAEPGSKYNVYEFQKDFKIAYDDVLLREKVPVMCGGSGLYVEAILNNYKLIAVPVNEKLRQQLKEKTLEELITILSKYKSLHNTTDIDTVSRVIRAIEIEQYYQENKGFESPFPNIKSLVVGINIDRDSRRRRISNRLKERLNSGMISEVEHLMSIGLSIDDLIYYGLEYKFVALYLSNQLSYEDMYKQLETAIHQFAKRQMTWFRRMERNGCEIRWVDALQPIEDRVNIIEKWFFE